MKKITALVILSLLGISCLPHRKKIMEKKNFKFYTDYHQFYLEDRDDEDKGHSGSSDFWSEEAFKERLALANGIIGVGVESSGNDIKGEIEILERPINIDYNKYDHIVEAGINIRSGSLQIFNCPDHHLELTVKVPPGKYRVRVYSSNLASVKETDMAHETDNDYYRIELWPSDHMERKVLKQYDSK
ncbi:hypothetical protein LUD75_04325 [Epilithonimonas sp. JDS]|uniref:hypothetical protein n=1 Tax=Epilithonimonas sp. JDS TaxID=2902797 RepID=UPI001E421D09|nr:hypothetical protein [Epilithonimonas sp. JDS]MCD9853915.1 hypothetical protein [Epilithonimonas sp. JDS]